MLTRVCTRSMRRAAWGSVMLAGLLYGAAAAAQETAAPAAEVTPATPVDAAPAALEEKPAAASQKRSQVAEMPAGVLQLDETVISGNQELPKVLYILPWREPQGLPDIEIQAEFTEAEVFRRLYPPAYRRELGYFETLRGLKENISPDQEE